MNSYFYKLHDLRRWAGIDRPVFYLALGRAWSFISGPISMLLIARFFTPETQGYYYTFGSVMGLQVFLEMGFAQCIVQFASHEFALLRFEPDGSLGGDPKARSRLISLGRLCLKWYAVLAVLVIVGVGLGGHFFFALKHDPSIAWAVPWWSLCVVAGISLALMPIGALLEGCNQLGFVYGQRIFAAIAGSLALWTALCCGAGLFTGPITTLAGVAVTATAYVWFFWGLVRELRSKPSEGTVSWHREIWPFQWRIGVSWASGYFAFQLFNPVLFYFHGPVVAGQMGMTLQLVASLNALAAAWVGTKAPRFGMLISQKKFDELDRLFLRSTVQGVAVCVGGGAALLLGLVFVQSHFHKFGARFLGPGPAALLVLNTLVNQVIGAQAIYLRAHKREPFVWVSVIGCSATGLLVFLLSRFYGAWGACAASAIVPIILVVWTSKIWRDCRKSWHEPDAPSAQPNSILSLP